MLKHSAKKPRSLRAKIVSGSFILLSGSGLATIVNFGYNVAVARFLGPKGFGHATAVYTLLIFISAVTLSFQIVSAKIVAQQKTPEGKAAGYRGLHRQAWACGIVAGLILLLLRRSISDYLNLPGPILIVLIAIGAAFYVPLGSRRGYLQGAYGFRRLATNLVLEGAIRLGGSLLLILLGFGVSGVIAANSAAVAVAYFAIAPKLAGGLPVPFQLFYAARELLQAVVFFAGQVLINSSDIVLVKHFFAPRSAGLYAAVALVGRVIFVLSSSVVNSMFPLVAGSREEDRRDFRVIATALLLVLGMGLAIAIVLRVMPAWVWMDFFGNKFEIAGKYNMSYLFGLYAITSVTYSLSAVIITFEMSYKIANTSWVQLAFSGLMIAGICLFHSSLRQVILVQLVLLTALLLMVAVPFLISSLTDPDKMKEDGDFEPVRVVRKVTEDEVIAAFLRSDFHHAMFREYQEDMREIVFRPNLDDALENAKRRALFLMRHQNLWNELPAGLEWQEIDLTGTDMRQIRVFPRAQWRTLARGNFRITEIVERLRERHQALDDGLLSKLAGIREQIYEKGGEVSRIVLIGAGPRAPLTILDGNHRLVSAMLDPVDRVHSLQFVCGLSPKMKDCCWYNTNLRTLLHYGHNVLMNAFRHPEEELERLPQSTKTSALVPARAAGPGLLEEAPGQYSAKEGGTMTMPKRNVVVKRLPLKAGAGERRGLMCEIQTCANAGRPRIVLDCSEAREMGAAEIHVALCCLEEAMKRNGDVRLAGLSPDAEEVLEKAGARRLFEAYDTVAEAVASFYAVPMSTGSQVEIAMRSSRKSESVA